MNGGRKFENKQNCIMMKLVKRDEEEKDNYKEK